jgi:DNA repair protein RecO (recombination protein O)
MPSRERSFRVEAVVLRHSDWGEADRILTLYSRERGKFTAIGKGVRKLRSRKAGHLEPFTRVSLQMAQTRDMPIITQVETIQGFPALSENLLLFGYASYVIELVDRFTFPGEENQSIYRLLATSLERLDQGLLPDLVNRYFELRLLDQLGFKPRLFQCARCEAEIQPVDQYFSAQDGGVLCPKCGSGVQGARPVSMKALKYLRHFQRSTFAQAARAQIAPGEYTEMENLLQYYLTYLLERSLNTPVFLRRLIRQANTNDPDPAA